MMNSFLSFKRNKSVKYSCNQSLHHEVFVSLFTYHSVPENLFWDVLFYSLYQSYTTVSLRVWEPPNYSLLAGRWIRCMAWDLHLDCSLTSVLRTIPWQRERQGDCEVQCLGLFLQISPPDWSGHNLTFIPASVPRKESLK